MLLCPAQVSSAERRPVVAWSTAFRFSRNDHHVEHALKVSAASRLIRLAAREQRRAHRRSRRSEEHTSELQSLMRISYAVFCLKKKKPHTYDQHTSNISKH